MNSKASSVIERDIMNLLFGVKNRKEANMKNQIRIIGIITAMLLMAGCAAPTALPTQETTASKATDTFTSPTAAEVQTTATPEPELTSLPTGGGSGEIVFGSKRGGDYEDIYLMKANGTQVVRLTQGDSTSFPGPFSPDGKQLLYTGFGLTTSYVGIMNSDGSGQTNLTSLENVDEGFPAWSPDGTRIVFTSRRDGNNEIYVMNADGSNPVRLTNHPRDDFAPCWSPDGSRILFVSDRDNDLGINSIYVMNTDGSGVTRLTFGEGNDYTPVWSPDGLWIAFRSIRDGQSDIYLMKADGSEVVNLTNSASEEWSPAWSPDGKMIAFQTNRDGNWEIYIMNSDGSGLINLTNDPSDDEHPYWK